MCIYAKYAYYNRMNLENHTKNVYSLITLLQYIFICVTFTRRMNALFHDSFSLLLCDAVRVCVCSVLLHVQKAIQHTSALPCVFSFTWLVFTLAFYQFYSRVCSAHSMFSCSVFCRAVNRGMWMKNFHHRVSEWEKISNWIKWTKEEEKPNRPFRLYGVYSFSSDSFHACADYSRAWIFT